MMLFDEGRPRATQTMEGNPGAAATAATSGTPYNTPNHTRRKRKADSQPDHNERLSKRLSLLNIEHSGPKLYVPVESSQVPSTSPFSSFPSQQQPLLLPLEPTAPVVEDDTPMQLDDSKHKVYIYNLDDELTSSESEPEDGRLVFLPNIEKHLRATRAPPIPRPIYPNNDGELVGTQMVLYNVPSSITVPEENDSVRKAIIETRARVRQRQQEEREAMAAALSRPPAMTPVRLPTISEVPHGEAGAAEEPMDGVEDPDAMDID